MVADVAQGVAVVRIARQRLGMHELTARGAGIGGDDGDLDAELVGRAGLALADALGLAGMEGIELPAARWRCCCERIWEACVNGRPNAASRCG